MTIGPVCDMGMCAFEEGDTVFLTAYTYFDEAEMARKWTLSRAQCVDHAIREASEYNGINAAVEAEVGPQAGDGHAVYNPEVIDLNTPEGYDA